MKKLLPLILSLGLCAAVGFSADPPADKKSIKKDDAPAEGKAAHKGGSPAEKKSVVKKDDAPAPGGEGKTQKVTPAEKKGK